MRDQNRRNKYFFGLGTVGRDMFYAFEANTILYFLTNVLSLSMWVFAITSVLLSVLRIVDAVNDSITGLVIDNIRSPWGKFKPAILIGGLASAVFFLMLFGNIGTGWVFIIVFALAYILWDISYGINDIGYCTTTSFATYYMEYVYGDINMYAILAAVVGVAQIAALLIFPCSPKSSTANSSIPRLPYW